MIYVNKVTRVASQVKQVKSEVEYEDPQGVRTIERACVFVTRVSDPLAR